MVLEREQRVEVRNEPPIQLPGRLRDHDEAPEIVAVHADRELSELLERNQLRQCLRLRDREVGEEAVLVGARVRVEVSEFLEDTLVHEHVAGRGGEVKARVAQLHRL